MSRHSDSGHASCERGVRLQGNGDLWLHACVATMTSAYLCSVGKKNLLLLLHVCSLLIDTNERRFCRCEMHRRRCLKSRRRNMSFKTLPQAEQQSACGQRAAAHEAHGVAGEANTAMEQGTFSVNGEVSITILV
ncbi:unnamed protein product [Urochloa humidicola]